MPYQNHLAASLLAIMALSSGTPALATQSPSQWTVSSFAGQAGSSWVANVTVRQTTNAYAYRTQRHLLLVNGTTGCVEHQELLSDTSFVDTNATGQWAVTSDAGEDADTSLLADIAPPVPGDWAHLLSITEQGLQLHYDGTTHLLIPAETIASWAKLQLVSSSDELRLVETHESVDAWRDEEQVVFVELETTDRSIDVDYSRFVVPVRLNAAIDLLFSAQNDPISLHASQPMACQE